MELAPDTQSPLPTSTTSDGFKTPKAKRARTKSAAVTVPTLSFSPSPQRSMEFREITFLYMFTYQVFFFLKYILRSK
jgi:hypothetical protein